MLYCSWFMVRDRCSYFSFWVIFCPFTPLIARKINIKKKRQNPLEISSFHTSVPKIMIICYTVPEIWHVTDVIVIFHFGLFFALSPPNSLKNQNLKKMKKIPGDIIILQKFNKNYDQMMYSSWNIVHDGRTDGKWHIEVGAQSKKDMQ